MSAGSKATPGEWTIGDVSKTIVDAADGKRKGRLAASIHHPGNLSWPLMRVGASTDDDLEEVMANARLVIAAKDLKAFAASWVRFVEATFAPVNAEAGLRELDDQHELTITVEQFSQFYAAARAAIAKAEGRADA